MAALLGFMPWVANATHFEVDTFENTMQAIDKTWNFTASYGWDFPMLATAAHRLGRISQAFDFLLHPAFDFDDVGMPIGGTQVPTPYMPSSGSLLMAVAVMAADGFDNNFEHDGIGPSRPSSDIRVEGFGRVPWTRG